MRRARGSRVTKLRAIVAARASWPVACPRCTHLIERTDAWDLGHITAHSEGGPLTLSNVRIEHSSCNRADGNALARNNTRRLRST